jgi:hypothetical protein
LNINLDPPVIVEDRQLAVLAAHVATTMNGVAAEGAGSSGLRPR